MDLCLQGVYPPYISWERFVENQRILRSNWYRDESRGAPRRGAALLQGIVYCGRCGARMTIVHYSGKEKRSPAYGCCYGYQRKGDKTTCQYMSAAGIDEAVSKLFLSAVSPAKVQIALQALEELDSQRQETLRQWNLQLQQADYDVELARRRYETADPENRLVAGELEARWEEALRDRERLQRERDEFERREVQPISEQDRRLVKSCRATSSTCGTPTRRPWRSERRCSASWLSAFIWTVSPKRARSASKSSGTPALGHH
jgi:hypothetical protein